jgi:hypothetical protein
MGHETWMVKEPNGDVVDALSGEVMSHGRLVWVPDKPKPIKGRDFFMGYHDGFEKLAADKTIRGRPRAILDLLFARLDWDNYVAISHAEISRKLDIQRPNVSAAFKLLVERGILDAGPKMGRNSTYRLNPEYAWKGSVTNRNADIQRRMKISGMTIVKGGKGKHQNASPNDESTIDV